MKSPFRVLKIELRRLANNDFHFSLHSVGVHIPAFPQMDSDDDFLIEDDEDFDSGTKDELFDIVKKEKAASGAVTPSSVPTTPSKAANTSNVASSPAKPAQNGSPAAAGPIQDGSNSAASAAQRQANPSLVVAPKPLTTPVASEEHRAPQNQAVNGAATYANFSVRSSCSSIPFKRRPDLLSMLLHRNQSESIVVIC